MFWVRLAAFSTIHLPQAEIVKQEARLRQERENLEKEKRMLMGTASNQENQVSRARTHETP